MKNEKKESFNFSVIISMFGKGEYLEDAILSVINQSIDFEKNIELILVNEKKSGNCNVICEKYAREYPNNITYLKLENYSLSGARNSGLDIAKGKIINFLEEDDYFSSNAFKNVSTFFKDNKDIDIIAIQSINNEDSDREPANKDYFIGNYVVDLKKNPNFIHFHAGASFIRRDVALRCRFDENLTAHRECNYLYKLFRDNPKCGIVSDAICYHRVRSEGVFAKGVLNHKHNIINMVDYGIKDIVTYYKEEYTILPAYVQSLIIYHFDEFVLDRLSSLELDYSEKMSFIKNIHKIVGYLSFKNIKNHPNLSEKSKIRYYLLKVNKDLLFKEEFLTKPELYYTFKIKIVIFFRKLLGM